MAVAVRLYFLIFAGILLLHAMPGIAAEYIRDQHPAGESAAGVHGPIFVAFAEPAVVQQPKKTQQTRIPAFISEGWVAVKPRSYYFLREFDEGRSDALDIPRKRETWALGGSIAAESGRLWDRVSIGGEYFASLPAYAPDRWPGSGLLQPFQKAISVLGQAYLRLAQGRQVATTGTSIEDHEEIDLTLDFRPEQNQLGGGWLRLRTAVLNPGTNRRVVDVRLIFNWTLSVG